MSVNFSLLEMISLPLLRFLIVLPGPNSAFLPGNTCIYLSKGACPDLPSDTKAQKEVKNLLKYLKSLRYC